MNLRGLPEYKNYFVDLETGDVYSNKSGELRKLKPSYMETSGYYMITLYDDKGKGKAYTQHAIVMAAMQQMEVNSWIDLGLTVHHKNTCRDQNYADNLEFRTRIAQATDEFREKLSKIRKGKPRAKITEQDVKEIRTEFANNKMLITQFARLVAKRYNMTVINAYFILKRITWKKVNI